jgi:hypothetical protein
MGLTTILTTIWVCPPKFALVQNPYFQGKLDDYGHCWTRCRCLGVKGLPWLIDFGSLKIGSDLRFRNGADSHEAAAKESTYA